MKYNNKIFSQEDECREALKKCNLFESAAEIRHGTFLTEAQLDIYNKIQNMLAVPELECAARFLYSVDPEDIDKLTEAKINNLWNLACDRGFCKNPEDEVSYDIEPEQPMQVSVVEKPVTPIRKNSFTIMYSAMKDGEIKMGECYSNAINPSTAKLDAMNKLEKMGYDNISVLAIEAGAPVEDYRITAEKTNENDIDEADDREPLSHALDPIGVKASSANLIGQDEVEFDLVSEKDDDSNEDSENNKSSDESKDETADKDDTETDKNDKTDSDETDKEDNEEDKDDSDETDNEDTDESKLTDAEKSTLKDQYKKAFKATLIKCKFEKSFNELTLDEKIKFFSELQKLWDDKAEPSEFLSAKDQDSLNRLVVKK